MSLTKNESFEEQFTSLLDEFDYTEETIYVIANALDDATEYPAEMRKGFLSAHEKYQQDRATIDYNTINKEGYSQASAQRDLEVANQNFRSRVNQMKQKYLTNS